MEHKGSEWKSGLVQGRGILLLRCGNMNFRGDTIRLTATFLSLVYISRNGMAGSFDRCVCSF